MLHIGQCHFHLPTLSLEAGKSPVVHQSADSSRWERNNIAPPLLYSQHWNDICWVSQARCDCGWNVCKNPGLQKTFISKKPTSRTYFSFAFLRNLLIFIENLLNGLNGIQPCWTNYWKTQTWPVRKWLVLLEMECQVLWFWFLHPLRLVSFWSQNWVHIFQVPQWNRADEGYQWAELQGWEHADRCRPSLCSG